MKVSVVTVCFNSAKTIGYTLESYFRQSQRDKELIIVDGGSTDRTLQIVKSFLQPGVTLISEPDRGMYDAMNKGLKTFSGDGVGFLNSDDRYHDDEALSSIAAALEDADITYGNLDFVADHASGRIVRRWRAKPFYKRAFTNGWLPPHPTFYVRREVVDTVGRYDTQYRIAADYDFMIRAMELCDFRVVRINRVLIDMMYGGGSTAGIKAFVTHSFESLRARQRWLDAHIIDRALVAKPLSKLNQFLVRE